MFLFARNMTFLSGISCQGRIATIGKGFGSYKSSFTPIYCFIMRSVMLK